MKDRGWSICGNNAVCFNSSSVTRSIGIVLATKQCRRTDDSVPSEACSECKPALSWGWSYCRGFWEGVDEIPLRQSRSHQSCAYYCIFHYTNKTSARRCTHRRLSSRACFSAPWQRSKLPVRSVCEMEDGVGSREGGKGEFISHNYHPAIVQDSHALYWRDYSAGEAVQFH